ncbi:MAG: hypothetical protein GPJ51_10200 [Candidatus Heimdallarchaeota archaeon]|nr:hypothetical protein [Candidatus Heimdallarchaeota archaeon]
MSSKKPEKEDKTSKRHYSDKKTAFEELAEEHGVELKDTTPMPGIKYCDKCGYANTPDDDRCFNCHSPFAQQDLFGKALEVLKEDEEEVKGKKKRKKKKKKN